MTAHLLTEDLRTKLCEAVSVGATLDEAAQRHNLGKTTLYRWQKLGRDELQRRTDGEAPNPELDIFVAFAEGVEEARGIAKVEALTIIRQHALGIEVVETQTKTTTRDVLKDGEVVTLRTTETIEKRRVEAAWQAAAWFLERRFPREFALRNRVELTGEGGGPVQISETARRMADEVEEFLASRGAPDDASTA